MEPLEATIEGKLQDTRIGNSVKTLFFEYFKSKENQSETKHLITKFKNKSYFLKTNDCIQLRTISNHAQ